MTKFITRSIAVLGVVAGIGVAALPAMSYAAEQAVSLSVTVNPTLAGGETVCTSSLADTIAADDEASMTCEIEYTSNGAAKVQIKGTNNTVLAGTLGGSFTAVTPASSTLDDDQWGYKFAVDQAGATSQGLTVTEGYDTNWQGVTTDFVTVAKNEGTLTQAAQGTFTFGAKAGLDTVADTYTGNVTISITAGN